MRSTLIVVTGFSCTGKTALAQKIGEHFSLPAIGRDDFKESLYSSLGYSDREWSKKLGIASYKLLYLTIEKLLSSDNSLVVESNFKVKPDTQKLQRLKDKYQCCLVQIHCHVEISLALARFKHRAESGERHPGHVDYLIYEEMEHNFKRGDYEIPNICDRTLKVDTTNFEQIDYAAIFQTIQKYLSVSVSRSK